MKRFLFIFFSTAVIGFVFYFGMDYQMRLREKSAIIFDIKPYISFASFFSIFIGMLLRLPKLILEIREKQRWSFDWMKFIVIGIPSLYIAMIPLFAIVYGMNLWFSNVVMLLGDITFTTIAGVIFGYVLLDSLNSKASTTIKVL
ncbi:hypothetical protein MPH47_18405 [Psychrobacillus psychrodurans]|uniref:hypothetical protein n=1 Tax=Psychrobacillus TaxID=1221880 RepID=UPI0008E1EB00|nr:hypothetical protein [Psychrobacillus psychrodurans]MCK1999168.1 hypothetical protein [Psychrobacillus psychrodurans]MCZ8541452.1 hypothetical protein [Psychrobacillus psychrodurans]SFM98800.1 hypothetical protein SAMN05421832_110148 [Psychrobacillus psychrodurans]